MPLNVLLFTIVSKIFLDSSKRLVFLKKKNKVHMKHPTLNCLSHFRTHLSSASTWSNSELDTRNIIEVTEVSKHLVHFWRCVRWPPTSTNTNGMFCNKNAVVNTKSMRQEHSLCSLPVLWHKTRKHLWLLCDSAVYLCGWAHNPVSLAARFRLENSWPNRSARYKVNKNNVCFLCQ